VKVTASAALTHNPCGEAYWASGLRANLPSRSYGEGLETGRAVTQVPRQSFTRQRPLRASTAFAGCGHDQCRKHTRVVGANTLRLLLAAARTLWCVAHTARTPAVEVRRYRPWYRQKVAPSPLDIVWTGREALHAAGVFPLPRFASGLTEISQESENVLPLAA
jgi:hypothetical protein